MGLFGKYAKPAPAGPSQVRTDGWVNPMSGLGGYTDKGAKGVFIPGRIVPAEELSNLYYNVPIAAKIVDTVVDEAFQNGYTLSGIEASDAKRIYAEAEKLDLDTHFTDAAKWGRLFGGGLLLKGFLDGQDPINPIAPGARKPIAFLHELDCRYTSIRAYNRDITKPRFGEPSSYQLSDLEGGNTYIDSSRVIRFDGIKVDRMKQKTLSGWSLSVLQRVYDSMREFGLSWAAANLMMSEATQGVFKMKGLRDALTDPTQRVALMLRMAMTDQTKGVGHSVMVDEDEDFKRIDMAFGGVDAMIDRFMMGMASAADMPVTKLFGRSAAGMNATGDGDRADWHKQVKTYQEKEVGPKLLWLYKEIAASLGIKSEDMAIEWAPLEEMSEDQEASLYLKTAQADNIYVQMGAIEPEQVTIARWGQGFFDSGATIVVNVEALQATLDGAGSIEEKSLELTPTDLAAVTKVNEARRSVGLDPLPGKDGDLTIPAFTALGESNAQQSTNQSQSPPGSPPVGSGNPKD